MVRVGLIGCGTIGSRLAVAIQRDYAHVAKLVALHDVDPLRAHALQRKLHHAVPIVSLPTLLRRSQLVLETASVTAAVEVVPRALRLGRSVFVMSVGGLLLDRRWKHLARRFGGKVMIPSGALAGLDGIKALATGKLQRVSLTSSKPPRALADAPYVRRHQLKLARLKRPRVIFQGSVRDVVKAFPQNTNVAAALALASGDAATRTRVRVVADPTARTNVHELEVEGNCGRLHCRIESRPSRNPKTSELAVRSALVTLKRFFDPIAIGT